MSVRRSRLVFAILDVLSALVYIVAPLLALGTLYPLVNLLLLVPAGLYLASATGLALGAAWHRRLATFAARVAIAVGVLAISVLALSAGHIEGVYGSLGNVIAAVLAATAVVLAFVCFTYPCVTLHWLRHHYSR